VLRFPRAYAANLRRAPVTAEPTISERPVAPGPNLALVRLLCVLAGLAGALTFGAAAALSAPTWQHVWPTLLFGVGMAGLQIVPLSVSHEGQGEAIHLEEAFLVPMALYLTPAESLAVVATAVLVGQVWHPAGAVQGRLQHR